MTGLAVWVSDRDIDRDAFGAMKGCFTQPTETSRGAVLPGIVIAASAQLSTSVHFGEAHGYLVAAVGRPRFVDSATEAERARDGFAETFANRYALRGADAFGELTGSFAVVVVDRRTRAVASAVDRMSIETLVYAQVGGDVVVSTTCDAILSHPRASFTQDPQSVYEYFYFHAIPAPRTVYQGVKRLLPGEVVRIAQGQIEHRMYWAPRFEERRETRFAELKKEFIDVLSASVRDCLDEQQTGAFLSGGTDSSTMAGLITRAASGPARTFSIGFDEPGYDEMSYARIAARHFGTLHREYYVTASDIVAAIPKIGAAYDQPFGNSSAVPTYYCAMLARRDGVSRMIGGDGGDELFGGNARYAKQHVFSLYERVPVALRHGFLEPVIARGPLGNLPGARKVRSYIEQARLPMPDRLESYNLIDRVGHDAIFTSEFLAAVDPARPIQHLRAIYHGAHTATQINRNLALDFRLTLADNDLPKVREMCRAAGVEAAFPMLDDRVVAFSLCLAPRLKLKGTKLRYFFKEALRDFLPLEIINKPKHGFGLPIGPWLAKHAPLQRMIEERLHALSDQRILRREFSDSLLKSLLAEHAGFYGTLGWVAAMFAEWQGQRSSRADTAQSGALAV